MCKPQGTCTGASLFLYLILVHGRCNPAELCFSGLKMMLCLRLLDTPPAERGFLKLPFDHE